MQVRDFISHDWQTIGAIQISLARVGISIPEVKLRKLLGGMPCVIVKGGMVRQTSQVVA